MVSYISLSIKHLDTQRSGDLLTESEHTPKRTETEFFANSVSLIKLYLGLTQLVTVL